MSDVKIDFLLLLISTIFTKPIACFFIYFLLVLICGQITKTITHSTLFFTLSIMIAEAELYMILKLVKKMHCQHGKTISILA
jgi:hypothetical protein